MPSVLGLFKRDSISSTPGSRRGSLQSLQHGRMDSPRHSIGSDGSGNGSPDHTSAEMTSVGVGIGGRRGSTFLATPILEVVEETERDSAEVENEKPEKKGAEGPSPSHVGKFTLEKIDEGDITNSNTKL
jgi:hypothetical protein